MAKKKHKFPAKFRQTLEKVAVARDEREAAAKRTVDPAFGSADADSARTRSIGEVIHTMWHDFIPKKSMELCVFAPDFATQTLKADWWMHDPAKPDLVEVSPPWDPPEREEHPQSAPAD